jgi:hypothetical protein
VNSRSLSPSSTSASSTPGSASISRLSNRISISADDLVNLISSSEATINYCASQFHRYSADEIRRLDNRTLHRLLGSRSLRPETEDQFLRFLINLGSDYYEFWNYVEQVFLTADGIALFGSRLPFDYVSEDIWKKIFVRTENKPDESIRIRRFLNSIPSARLPESIF